MQSAAQPIDEDLTVPSPWRSDRIKQIWSVGGGKGGVGKSLLASNFAISLSRLGNKVIAIDLDLGGANLHTALGVDLPRVSLSDYISRRKSTLSACQSLTEIPNIEIISGAQDSVDIANLPEEDKKRLMHGIFELDADYLIFDLGAGSNFNTLDFFNYSDLGLIALLPEPTSIENAYRFIKSAYYRRLRLSPGLSEIYHLIDAAMDSHHLRGIKSPSDLFREAQKQSPELGMRLKIEVEKFQPKVIVNQARTQADIEIGHSVRTVCRRYFGIEMDYAGCLDYDPAAWQAVRRKRPLMLEFPNSKLVSSIEQVTQNLIKLHGQVRSSLIP